MDLTIELNEELKYCSNRVDQAKQHMEESTPNEAPPTITSHIQQLEASHEMILSSVISKMNQASTIELAEDTPLYRRNFQKLIVIGFITAATRKDRKIKPVLSFLNKRDWNSLKLAYGG